MRQIAVFTILTLGLIIIAGCGSQQSVGNPPISPKPLAESNSGQQGQSDVAIQAGHASQVQTNATDTSQTWKTFTNPQYGFEFRYPAEYEINQQEGGGPGGAVFGITVGDNIVVTVAKIEKGLRNGTDPLSEPNGMDPASQKETTIDGQKARIYNDEEVYVVAKDGFQYFLERDSASSQQVRNVLETMAKTFKFTK